MMFFLLQLPTPTPLPDTSMDAPIEMPDMSLWDFAPDAIQVWNSVESKSGMMTLFQLVLLVMLILGIAVGIKMAIDSVTSNRDV